MAHMLQAAHGSTGRGGRDLETTAGPPTRIHPNTAKDGGASSPWTIGTCKGE